MKVGVPNAPAAASSGGSAGVFGILLIIVGIVLAFLFVTGRLAAIWADVIGTGNKPAATVAGTGSTTPTATQAPPISLPPITSYPSVVANTAMNAGLDPISTTAISAAIGSIIDAISKYNSAGSSPGQPQVPAASTPTYPSSSTIGTPAGVTGHV